MMRHVQIPALLTLLLFTTAPLSGGDATGSVRFVSCDLYYKYRMEMVRFQKKKLEKSLAFRIPDVWVLYNEKGWIDVPGEECTGPGHCEMIMKSKIQVLHISSRWGRARAIIGLYEALFSDGRKLQGSFNAKFVNPMETFVCE